MCLIIQREPNFEIPYDKFESAILNNPDGYGLSYPDKDGRLITIRNPDEPDPMELYRTISEELLEQKLMVHLRFTTAGATNLRNAHPFPILERGKDGVDLRMAHNGTLHKYKKHSSDESDTRVFVREFVRPLFKRLVRGMEPEELLNDPFTKKILEDQLTTASVLTFLDGNGNTLICNETGNGGKKEEGWYYSNTYSFNPSHRVKPTTTATTTTKTTGTGGAVATYNSGGRFKDTNVKRFSQIFNLKSIEDTFKFTDQLVEEIAGDPSTSESLIKELILELQSSREKCTRQENRIKLMEKKDARDSRG